MYRQAALLALGGAVLGLLLSISSSAEAAGDGNDGTST